MAVGRGGSQTFTITPNAGYRINQVLVNGVNNAAAVASGTYTFTNVQANQTIAASFTQSAATITSSAGAGGSISPNGTQTVAIGGTQTYTITPNNGYAIDDVLVDGVNDGRRRGTYTFTNVTANHTIAATFATNEPDEHHAAFDHRWLLRRRQPAGLVDRRQGDRRRRVLRLGEPCRGWYYLKTVAANGTASYSTHAPLNLPMRRATGSSSVIAATPGTGTFTVFGDSTGTFDVLGLASIAVTGPTGSQLVGAPLPISWTASSIVTTGEFGVWASNGSGWAFLTSVPANAASADYAITAANVPVGTGYSIVSRLSSDRREWTRGRRGAQHRHV